MQLNNGIQKRGTECTPFLIVSQFFNLKKDIEIRICWHNGNCSLNVRKLAEVCKIGNDKHIQENALSYSSFLYWYLQGVEARRVFVLRD